MTNERMLERLVSLGIGTGGFDMIKYRELVEDLKADIMDENNKKTGRSNVARLGKAILKNAVKNTGGIKQNINHMMRYAHTVDGVQYVLDSHRIAWFYNPIDLPEWNNKNGEWYHIEHMLDMELDDTPLELPSIGEIKAELKSRKCGKYEHYIYVFENGLTINPKYLLDYMESLTNIKVYRSASHNYKREPIWIEGDEGGGVILPVNGDDRKCGFYVV